MKIICINNIDNTLCITVGRIYDVIGTYKSMYGNQIKYRIVNDEIQKSPLHTDEDRFLITNDLDHDGLYSRKYFKMLSDIREEKLNTILG